MTPDGRFVAFQRTVGGPEDVFLYDRSTSSLVPLPGLNSGFDDAGPSLTPDGRLIAFTTARSGDANWEDVLLYDRSTSSLVPLPGLNTNGPGGFHEGGARISSDGRFIVFSSNRSGVADIFLYDRSISSLVALPGLNDPAFRDANPSISADARFIAFYSERGDGEDVFLYDRSTSSLMPLPGLNDPAFADFVPSLSADGRFIAFASDRNGRADVFVYDRSTSSLVSLPGLNEPGIEDNYPAIAFSGFAPPPTNRPPVANAGRDQDIHGFIDPTAFPPGVVLDGSASFDPDDNDRLTTYIWREGGVEIGRKGIPVFDVTAILGPGEHIVTLEVIDEHGLASVPTNQGGDDDATVRIRIAELVILVHGFNSSPDGLGRTGEFLASPEIMLGHPLTVVAYNYSGKTDLFLSLNPVEAVALDFASFLGHPEALSITGAPGPGLLPDGSPYRGTANVLAHSLGGLVVRTYAAGLANVRYRGEFKKLVMAGTPNYGLLGASLARALSLPNAQVREVAYGSPFIWKLHEAWSQAPPVPAQNVLGIAGSVGSRQSCADRLGLGLDGSTDGLVELTSVALASSSMQRLEFVGYKHWEGFLKVKECAVPQLVRATHPLHDTFRAVRSFFVPEIEMVPLIDPRPDGRRHLGMLLIRVQEQLSGDVIVLEPRMIFLVGAEGHVAGCQDTPPTFVAGSRVDASKYFRLRCNVHDETGIATLLDVPVLDIPGGDRWTVSIEGDSPQLGGAFVLERGRSATVVVELCSKKGCAS
jgi:hypothetical protein